MDDDCCCDGELRRLLDEAAVTAVDLSSGAQCVVDLYGGQGVIDAARQRLSRIVAPQPLVTTDVQPT